MTRFAPAALCVLLSSTVAAAAEKPNVILILADDMGFSDAGCYGGDIRTPNLDALAAGGLKFTQHYSTGRCWPSRACIQTGYYAQQVRRDSAAGIRMGNRPAWAPLLPDRLTPLGYHCYHSGKWHIDGNPKENGFERSWGGERSGCDWDRFFASKIWEEDGVKAPGDQFGEGQTGEGYYSTIAIADHAIQCLKSHEKHCGDAPFYSYVAFYSPHFPLHALQKDIDTYRETYLDGWDVMRQRRWQRMTEMGIIHCPLSERDQKIIPRWNLAPEKLKEQIDPGEAPFAVAWSTLTDRQKKFQATKMAIHAAMVTRMDMEIGRIVQHLKDTGAYDNTLILFAADNGASAEQIIRGDRHDKSALPGSAKSYLCLGPGWSTVANTPLRLHKHWNHEGGISSPLIMHWPEGIAAKGELRRDPSHFIDIAPTIVELAGGSWPKTRDGAAVPPNPGISLVPTLAKDGVVKHEALWWCHAGNQAIRMGDWKLSMRSGSKRWELYNLKTDRCEMDDLAAKHPDKAKELADRWQAILDGFIKDLGT
ncbi:MAG: arylsulfatase [Candidatus Nealsonbacteria bacterium]|nr:arylsulfatase [Candidatus Nealsonbacteria bacterium]